MPTADHGSNAPIFLRSDGNGDGSVDLADAVAVLVDLYLGAGSIPCTKAADAEDGGRADVSDAVFLLGYLFTGGDAPPEPDAACGPDPSPDALPCKSRGT